MAHDPPGAGRGPSDIRAYLDLLGRCVEADSREQLVALMPEIVTFEGGLFEVDFKSEWFRTWLRLGLPPAEMPDWPPGGPLSAHAAP